MESRVSPGLFSQRLIAKGDFGSPKAIENLYTRLFRGILFYMSGLCAPIIFE